jgi:hypothetical protein
MMRDKNILFIKIMPNIVDPNDYLLWMPLSDEINDQDLFFKYDPPMIAKTHPESNIFDAVSRSFMQMQSGGYIVMDSLGRFIELVIDGYYMLTFIRKDFMNNNLLKYLDNWRCVDDHLDDVLKNDLYRRV